MSYCNFDKCKTQASFGYADAMDGFNAKEIIACKKHKNENMIKLYKICVFDKCFKNASFGYIIKNNKQFISCSVHKKEDMIAFYQKCKNCGERARYNYLNVKGALYCTAHKLDNMYDKNKSICIIDNCTNYASFKDVNTNKNIYCTMHSKNVDNTDIISSKNKTCKEPNCSILANFGIVDDPMQYCANHKKENMYDHRHKRCEICNLFLMKHGNIICAFCNPDSTHKKNEKIVYDFLTANNKEFVYNHSITFNYLRPDFLLKINDNNIIIECDEKQHKNYNIDSENNRMIKIKEHLDNKTIFIRFNPDTFKINNKLIRLSINTKLNILLNFINSTIDMSFDCYYLFYDCNCNNKCTYIHSKLLN